jgi:hypothetical protein
LPRSASLVALAEREGEGWNGGWVGEGRRIGLVRRSGVSEEKSRVVECERVILVCSISQHMFICQHI